MAASSSSSSISRVKYEVFISFRGKDVRFGFLSHIHKALVEKKIHTFVDEQLERGEEISSSLLEIIERSAISVVIFSENYADSPWCLDELVKILDCKKTMGQIVIPVFYLVQPDQVQDLTGSFGKAISEHKKDFNHSLKVENWCHALMETSSLSGFDSHNYKSESEVIEEIIKHIQQKLNHLFKNDCSYNDGLVGIHSRVENVKLLLQCKDVLVVGIWGPGGIGKTTIAQKVFHQICHEFESYCFVANVTEKFEKCSDAIHNELLSKLLAKDGFDPGTSIMTPSYVSRRLSQMQVLIVLDDVSDFDQIKSIMTLVHYGSGSRVIVTSRDKQLLVNVDAKIYKVEELNEWEALQLFCFHAFRQNIPDKEFVELSKRAVECAGGLPLALQVFGCNLRCKSVEDWNDALENLKDTPNEKVHKILRRSYEGLCKDEKEIFLDIACFFKGKGRDYVESILAKDLPDRATKVSGLKYGIGCLVDKSLISISSTNCVDMHDLIQHMAWEIASEEQKLKKRTRLWKSKEVIRLLTKKIGSDATKGLSLDMSKIKVINLSPEAFKKMDNLKYLILYDPSFSREIRVNLPEGLEFLSEEIRCLYWYGYPLKSLPKSFCAENLVELAMPNSQLEELWNGVQNLENLKYIDLQNNTKLVKIPDLSRAQNLEILNLDWNESLVEIPSTLRYLTKLVKLNLWHCTSLSNLPSCLHMINLKSLELGDCRKLTMIPNIPCYERHPGHAKEKMPSPMGCQFQLRILHLDGCSRLEYLPDSICSLIYLVNLRISGCSNLRGLPEKLGNLKFLEEIIADNCGINKLPDSLCNMKNLKILDVGDCVNLSVLPQNLGNLESLKHIVANGSGINKLPDSICSLKNLESLVVSDCVNLCGLPQNLGNLESLGLIMANGTGINKLPDSICILKNLQWLDVGACVNLSGLPQNLGNLESLQTIFAYRSGINKLPDSICTLKNLVALHVGGCVNLCGLPQNLGNLESLEEIIASGTSIKELPFSINDLRKLNNLLLKRCKGLKLPMWTANSCSQVFMTGNFPELEDVDLSFCEISEFPSSLCSVTSLKSLDLSGNNFESIPKYIKQLSRLEILKFRDCGRLKYIPGIIEIFDLWSQMKEVDFGNCINLDQSQISKMMDYILTRYRVESFQLCTPGRELPQRLMYQNNNGSSLSFLVKLLQHMDSFGFYVYAVLDPQMCEFYYDVSNVGYDVDIIDESGHCIYSGKDVQRLHDVADEAFRSTHMLLWHHKFHSKDLIKGNKYTIVFKFYAAKPRYSITKKDRCSSDAIIKCGVHPLFGFDDGLID